MKAEGRTVHHRRAAIHPLQSVGILLILGWVAAGCTLVWTGEDGTRHHLILGAGMVSTHERTGMTAYDARYLGAHLDSGGLSAGLGQEHFVEIDPAKTENLVVSVHATPLTMTVKNLNVEEYERAALESAERRRHEVETAHWVALRMAGFPVPREPWMRHSP